MLEKKDFLKYMSQIETAIKFQDEMNDICKKYGYFSIAEYPDCIDLSVTLLEKLMNLEPNDEYGTDISYFIFELNFGKDWEPGSVTCDGEDIDFSSSEKLYDFITKGE